MWCIALNAVDVTKKTLNLLLNNSTLNLKIISFILQLFPFARDMTMYYLVCLAFSFEG